MNLTAILIEDEKRARELLKALLQDYCPNVVVLDSCEDLPTGVKAIHKHKPDVVFLDIEMPGHSGLEILDFFYEQEINFDIIFITAYSEHAIDAFQLSATDYLLKPIKPERLKEAVERVCKRRESALKNSVLHALKNNISNNEDKKISVPVAQGIRLLSVSEIILLKADGAYTEILLTNNETLLVSRNLRQFEDVFSAIPEFYRSSKSFIINSNYITQVLKSDGGKIILQGNIEAALSPDKKDGLIRLIENKVHKI